MRLVCEKCDCEMTILCTLWSTQPIGYICPKCKYKVMIIKE